MKLQILELFQTKIKESTYLNRNSMYVLLLLFTKNNEFLIAFS